MAQAEGVEVVAACKPGASFLQSGALLVEVAGRERLRAKLT